MTRRILLGTGAAVVGGAAALTAAQLTHRLDDVAEAFGVDPRPLPDPEDTRIVRRAGRDAAMLLALVEATRAAHPALELVPFETIVRDQVDAVSGETAATDSTPPPAGASAAADALAEALETASTARELDAGAATSPDLARVLASMSAGLAQAARGVRRLR